MNACIGCRFWKAFTPDAPVNGDCRRHAPRVFDRAWHHPEYGMQDETKTAWPMTSKDDGCGDFIPKE